MNGIGTDVGSRKQVHRRALLVIAALCTFFALGAPAAFAAYEEIGSFGKNPANPGSPGNPLWSGTADGFLLDPGQADVYGATERIYVADTGNNRVQVFKPLPSAGPLEAAGEYESKLAITAPRGLAIDQSSGAVYVSNAAGVSKFTSALTPAAGWSAPAATGPLAVDPASGDLLVADTAGNLVRRFDSNGAADGSFAAPRPIDLDVTASGDVLVITSSGDVQHSCGPTSAIKRFSAAGVDLGTVAPGLEEPGAIAVDPDDGSILVAANVNEYFCEARTFGQYDLVQLSSAGAVLQTLAVFNSYAGIPGIAAPGGSGRAYTVSKGPNDDEYGGTAIAAFVSLSIPEVTINPVDPGAIGATEATVHGEVDPNGKATTYHFEYARGKSTVWASTPAESAGSGQNPVPVDAVLQGLVANSAYRVRLVATNGDETRSSNPVEFQTVASVPGVTTLAVSGVGAQSARLNGRVNPGGLPTTYRFEWGPTTAYGQQTPAVDAALGDAGVPLDVSRLLTGLAPDSTYHFRVVAENSLGAIAGDDVSFTTGSVPAACANEAVRVEQGATGLPACRAWELVTPVQSRAWIDIQGAFSLPDGERVVFGSPDSLPGAIPNGPEPTKDSWMGHRTSTGWSTEWITDAPDGEPGVMGSRTTFASPDGSRTVMRTENSIDPADSFLHSPDGYLREASGVKTWLTFGPRSGVEGRAAVAATPELDKIVVEPGGAALTAEDTDVLGDVYLWSDGVPILQSVGTNTQHASVPDLGQNAVGAPGAISDDGRRVFFETQERLVGADTDLQFDLYVREDSATTRLISVERRATPTPVQDQPTFLAASRDGGIACFGTAMQLEEADTDTQEDVYCYDLDADALERVSVGTGDNLPLLSRPLKMSRDGSTVFFASLSPLIAEDTDGGLSMFARRNGITEYVAPLSGLDLLNVRRAAAAEQSKRALNVSEGGSVAVFTTVQPALPSDTDNAADVYLWRRSEGLTQVSIGPGGGNGPLESGSGRYDELSASSGGADPLSGGPIEGRVFNDDATAIFFESAEALVDGDTDGGRLDVYEWRDGRGVRLLTPAGAAPADAHYIDNSADGGTVFLVTPERILGRDINGSVRDLYAVRVEGGFTESATPPGCSGDGCQGPPAAPPQLPRPGSAVPGTGNLAQRGAAKPRKCPKGKRKVRRQGKTKCVPKRGKARKAGKSANESRGANR